MAIVTQLVLYPIKSCAGITMHEATLTAAGLMSGGIFDREWMLVGADGEFLTQRQFPQMATIKPQLAKDTLRLCAPNMPDLDIALARDQNLSPTVNVHIWGEMIAAADCGDACARWFANVLGLPCRLVRFHPKSTRFADKRWTADIDAPTRFADGFPILIIGEASLEDLNARLRLQQRDTLPMNRFRPNIVIKGIDPFEEDYARTISIGAASLRPVKPCPRCPMPSVDQENGILGPDPLDILQAYRANPKVDGAITFGMNAIVLEGDGDILRVGQECAIELTF